MYSTDSRQRYQESRTGLKDGYARLYMFVTADEYELPLIVTTSAQDLADAVGCKKRTVISELSRYRKGERHTQFRTVDVPIEEEDYLDANFG